MAKKKSLIPLVAISLVLAMSLATFVPMVYAWFVNPTRSEAHVGGNIKGSYFEDGDGTKNNPYIIARPIQLYYLAWLQNLGYFNRESTREGEEGTVRQFYFQMQGFDYQKNGVSSEGTVKDGVFDLSAYRLPPIGTTKYPFVGYFDGNGCVIDGLTVVNQFLGTDNAPRESADTVGTQALGFFGVVGTYGSTAGTVGTGANTLTYDTDDNEVTNFILSGLTVCSTDPVDHQTLVGLAAGYVNGSVTKVGVSDGTITVGLSGAGVVGPIAAVGNENESDFGLVGYCTENFKQTLQVEKVTVTTPTYTQNVLYKNTQQEGAGFGGSIKIKTMYDRIVSVFTNNAENPQYLDREYWTVNDQTGVTTHHTELDEMNGVNRSIKAYNPAGVDYSYTFSTYSSSSNSTTYMYLFGADTVGQNAAYPNTSGITKTVETEHYRHVTGTSYRISAIVGIPRDGGGYTIAYTSGGTTYYLNTNGSTVSAGTDPYTATAWTLPNSGSTGTISTVIGGVTYYLRRTNTTTSTTFEMTTQTADTNIWYRNGSRFYVTYNSRYYYIRYSSGWGIGNTNRTSNITSLSVSAATQAATYYLNLDAAGTALTYGTDAAAATQWLADGSNHYYTIADGRVKFLNVTSTTELGVGNTASSTWTYSNNRLYSNYGNSNRYLRFNNGWAVNSSTSYAATVTRTASDAVNEWAWVTELATEASSFTTKPTYFALNMSDAFTTSITNTGYVISGANYKNTTASNTNERYPSKSGDIRVSEYNMAYISNSLQNGTAYNDGGITSNTTNITYSATYDQRLEILTAVHTVTSGGTTYHGFYRITDTDSQYNTTHSYVNGKLSGYTAVLHTTLGLKRYEDARAELSDAFLNQNKIYGLHFMDAEINKNNTVMIPNATINGESIASLQVPIDCIDFNVKNRGFLTIFAGTYFSGNTAFFSLHEIFRHANNEIEDIKEISEIYEPLPHTNDYIYLYTDGTYSKNLSADQIASLVLAFDMDWMTNPGSDLVPYAVYYFEIPVNGGEFALGSVPGKDGAYLFYLDIAANGGATEDRDRVTVAEQFTTSTNSFTAPLGVQLIDFDASTAVPDTNTGADGQIIAFKPITNAVDYLESIAVRLKSGYTGTYPFARDGTEFNYLLNGNAELGFVGGSLTAVSTDGAAQNPAVGNYTIGGYTVRFVETVTDTGRDTNVTDVMRVETLDTYNANGVQTSREVTLLAGLESESDASNLVKIASFLYQIVDDDDESVILDYTDAAYDNIVMRVVRGSTIGGFNISFDRKVKITSTFCHESGHINFGDNTADVLIVLTFTEPLLDRTVPAVNLGLENALMGVVPYRKATVGDDLMTYYYYTDPAAAVTVATTATFTPADLTSASTEQSLAYHAEFASSVAIDVYATLLKDISQPYVTTVWVRTSDGTGTEQKNVTETITAVTVNTSDSLTTKDVTVKIPIAATPSG